MVPAPRGTGGKCTHMTKKPLPRKYSGVGEGTSGEDRRGEESDPVQGSLALHLEVPRHTSLMQSCTVLQS